MNRASPPGTLSGKPLLPPGRATLPLIVVISVMCALAALALLAGALAVRMSSSWLEDLAQTATVQLQPVAEIGPDEQSRQSIRILQNHAAVASARLMGLEETRKLLEPWLGADSNIEDLPLPRLVAVRLVPGFKDIPVLEAALKAVPGARLDSHENTRSQISRLGQGVETTSLIILVLVIAALVAAIAFATRASVESHRPIVEVLHLIGASDRFVARQFERHFLRLGLLAGAGGMLMALFMAVLFSLMAPDQGGNAQYLLPRIGLTGGDILLVLGVPLGAGLIGWATAHLTVLHILTSKP